MGRDDQGINNSMHRWQVIPRVLCFVTAGDDSDRYVLLLRGAPTKRIWANRLNGVGGHVERDEDMHTAVLREIHEETGLTIDHARLCGVVQIDSGATAGILMFVWTAVAHDQHVKHSDEGTLEWYSGHQLPTTDLVDDLAILLPRVLSMNSNEPPFFAHYSYTSDNRLQIKLHGEVPILA